MEARATFLVRKVSNYRQEKLGFDTFNAALSAQCSPRTTGKNLPVHSHLYSRRIPRMLNLKPFLGLQMKRQAIPHFCAELNFQKWRTLEDNGKAFIVADKETGCNNSILRTDASDPNRFISVATTSWRSRLKINGTHWNKHLGWRGRQWPTYFPQCCNCCTLCFWWSECSSESSVSLLISCTKWRHPN